MYHIIKSAFYPLLLPGIDLVALWNCHHHLCVWVKGTPAIFSIDLMLRNERNIQTLISAFFCLCCSFVSYLDMADDRGGMEASGTRAPRALGHLVFLLINFSDVCSNFISFLRGRKGSGTRVFGH